MPHLKSMTAYAESSHSHLLGCFTIELQSVNRKHLEIQLQLPQELQRFDAEVRKILQKSISRGQLTLKVFSQYNDDAPLEVAPNLLYAKNLFGAYQQMAESLKIAFEPDHFWQATAQDKNLFTVVRNDKLDWNAFFKSLEEALLTALKKLDMMKEKEATCLEEDIRKRLALIEENVAKIKEKAHDSADKLKKRLILKIEEFLAASTDSEERLMREVALYAEKVDITEELTRLNSHLRQFHALLDKGGAIGKTLDFLLQELNREINTIGSKAQDALIAHIVVATKSEIEKIREQIQNLE